MYSVFGYVHVFFFFFKQKTAYEMRISDWSSDVCSSDLLGLDGLAVGRHQHRGHQAERAETLGDGVGLHVAVVVLAGPHEGTRPQIGRASCRERVCQYV